MKIIRIHTENQSKMSGLLMVEPSWFCLFPSFSLVLLLGLHLKMGQTPSRAGRKYLGHILQILFETDPQGTGSAQQSLPAVYLK